MTSIYPLTLARQPLSYHTRGTAVTTFVSSNEYPVSPGILTAIRNDLDGVADPSDYEFLQHATESIVNPIGSTFANQPIQRIDYGPSPAEIWFHLWTQLVDQSYIRVQYQLNPALNTGSVILPPPTTHPAIIDRDMSDMDTVQDYEYGHELDLQSDEVPQDTTPNNYRVFDTQPPAPKPPTTLSTNQAWKRFGKQ